MSLSLTEIEARLDSGNIGLSDLLLIRREVRAPFKYHPLGFLVCTLASEMTRKIRLHYWPVTGGALQSAECQIHDHVFEFKSWVISGVVENVEYSMSNKGKEFAIYLAQYGDNTSILTKTSKIIKLDQRCCVRYSAGSCYTVRAGQLHETLRIGQRPALTVLLTDDVSTAEPVVVGPVNGMSRHVYQRNAVAEETIEAMLAKI